MATITLGTLRDYWKGVYDWVTGATASNPKVQPTDSGGNELFTAANPGNVQLTGSNFEGADTGAVPSKAVLVGGANGSILQALKMEQPYQDAASQYIQSLITVARQRLFNGTNWDLQRNNTEGTLLANAERTATVYGSDQTNYNARGLIVFLNVTGASGTGGLYVVIQGKDATGQYYTLNTSPPAVTGTGRFVYVLYPGATGTGDDVVQTTSLVLPRTWRVNIAHGDSSSYTYSVSYALIV